MPKYKEKWDKSNVEQYSMHVQNRKKEDKMARIILRALFQLPTFRISPIGQIIYEGHTDRFSHINVLMAYCTDKREPQQIAEVPGLDLLLYALSKTNIGT